MNDYWDRPEKSAFFSSSKMKGMVACMYCKQAPRTRSISIGNRYTYERSQMCEDCYTDVVNGFLTHIQEEEISEIEGI